ncbi:MAG TPA: FdhF/YdeP family oxidoreductase [Chthoniobacterales bacterium]|nr:FdhF/YdeP family oxidoreductase [Chthoniobacterales bacterium]
MPDHRVQHEHGLGAKVPFGLGRWKPKHFRDMAGVVWRNRDNLPYAWKVLSRGVCDGCALGVAGFHDWTIDGVHLCMTRLNLLRLNTMPTLDAERLSDISGLEKLGNHELRELGRLPYPMLRVKDAPGFRRISWSEAYDRIARRIRETNPRRLAFYLTSRGLTNEVYYIAQKVARFLGTNNIDNAARICHSPSGATMKSSIGVAATTCSYKDWYGTDLVIFFGSNPANDQPVATKYLQGAKKLGTKVVMVNPYLEPGMKKYWVPSSVDSALFGTEIADYWFPVNQGGDIAFLTGVLKVLIENGWTDESFINQHTAGFAELRARVAVSEWAVIEQQAGLPRASMQQFAELIRAAKNAVLVWSMGITQHPFGTDSVQMIVNLALARGYIGRDKNGVMPIRGHSSVQGGAEMGAYATALPGFRPMNSEAAAEISARYRFDVPDWIGLTATEMVEAAHRDQLDLFYCLGGNFLRTLPEPDYVADALRNVPLRVHQDIILTDQMLIPAREEVILLPAKTRYEQDGGGIETSTERRVMFSPEIPRQVGEAKAEWKILRELAVVVHPERAHLLGCEAGQQIREEIAEVVPYYDGVQHFRETGDAIQYGGRHLCEGGKFPTSDGKGHFRAIDLPELKRPAGSFHVSTRRGKQFNTLIYADVDPLNGAPRDAVLMNEEDAGRLHLRTGDRVALVNDVGRFEGRAFLAPIAPGNLQIHWPEGNVIIQRGVVDKTGGVPDYNAVVRVERLGVVPGAPHASATAAGHSHDQPAGSNGGMSHLPPFGEKR